VTSLRPTHPYIRVHGGWKYLYRTIDRDGVLVDVMLSEYRNLAAAKRFFRSTKAVTGAIPDRVTTDGHRYPQLPVWFTLTA
jgi:transposase-like protein